MRRQRSITICCIQFCPSSEYFSRRACLYNFQHLWSLDSTAASMFILTRTLTIFFYWVTQYKHKRQMVNKYFQKLEGSLEMSSHHRNSKISWKVLGFLSRLFLFWIYSYSRLLFLIWKLNPRWSQGQPFAIFNVFWCNSSLRNF